MSNAISLEDYVRSFEVRFGLIDKENPPDLATKKKDDIRKSYYGSNNAVKKEACEIAFQKNKNK